MIMDAKGVEDQEVWVGVRPEGFVLDNSGPLHCSKTGVEVMGRDVSVVATHTASTNSVIRAIIPSETVVGDGDSVSFSLKRNKTFIFRKEDEKRIRLEK